MSSQVSNSFSGVIGALKAVLEWLCAVRLITQSLAVVTYGTDVLSVWRSVCCPVKSRPRQPRHAAIMTSFSTSATGTTTTTVSGAPKVCSCSCCCSSISGNNSNSCDE